MSFAVFNDDNKLLPGFCKPYADEILSSWLTRMAFYHGLNTLEFCYLVLSQLSYQSYDIDRIITPEKINLLAEKTNCSFGEVEATTLLWYHDRLFTPANLTNGSELWLLPSVDVLYPKEQKLYHRSGLMFCPLCLKKKAYFKKQWRLALSFVCLECGCYLLDKCPHCKRGNSFMDVEDYEFLKGSLDHYLLSCHHCKKDVTECNVAMATKRMLRLQQMFYHIIEHGTGNPFVSKKSYLKVLSFFCRLLLNPLKRGSIKLGHLVQDVYELNGVSLQEHLKIQTDDLRLVSIRKRADVIRMAHWMLCEWPRRFINLCKNNEVERKHILSLTLKPPYWFYEPIYYELMPKDLFRFRKEPIREPQPEECTVRPKEKRIKNIDKDFAIDDFYDEDELYYEKEFSDPLGYARQHHRTQRFLKHQKGQG